MTERLAEARAEIGNRLEELRNLPGSHSEEQQAIQDALANLRVLEREDLRFSEKREAAVNALEKLRSISAEEEFPASD